MTATDPVIDLCEQWHRANDEVLAVEAREDSTDKELSEALAPRNRIEQQFLETRATTAAGVLAVIAIAGELQEEGAVRGEPLDFQQPEHLLLFAAARDAKRLIGAGDEAASTDRTLIEAEAEWQRLTREVRMIAERGKGIPYPASNVHEAEMRVLDDRRDAIAESIIDTPAQTWAGAAIKARIARDYLTAEGAFDLEEKLIVSAAGDFDRLGEGGAA